jgi:chromate transport protein ChrA
MVGFLMGWTGLVTAVTAGTLPLFVTATVLAGASQGIAISAATRALLHGGTPADRAPILAVVYLISYSGATIPSLISAQLSGAFSLPQITLGYAALALLATLFTALSSHNPRTTATGKSRAGEAGRASGGNSR